MHPSISDDESSGTLVMQSDEPLDFTSRIDLDLFKCYWTEETNREVRFTAWLERLDQARRHQIGEDRRLHAGDRAGQTPR